MKVRKAVLPFVFFCLAAGLFGEDGTWSLTPFLTRISGDVLILPEKPYSRPYRGIEELRFIDDYLLVLTYQGEEFRAFYEIIPGGAEGNRSLNLTFRSGKTLAVALAENVPGECRFEYRLGPDFFRTLDNDPLPEEASPDANGAAAGAAPAGPEPAEPPGTAASALAAPNGAEENPSGETGGTWFFTGTMKKRTP